uniref:Uncharacterized protein n=1 Tax=Chromera velia CCMP2878 TaxID=1169474 RepID=A0A0G4HFU4_9ALVE|eukprot:Cvel_27182.t1-p1 / transcript=Cvel_27182.t1 / gene=Cvel_27182 / organism=Chromera_velia_CCMP2878 / gene_product=hypothetical protein / transcript_product=hypothetical protein / location=Cvel_scaffold3353:3400-7187(+) / protein_length=134 / sequence_SO=supercontig / SO=protein_coding / is_pseudo=false
MASCSDLHFWVGRKKLASGEGALKHDEKASQQYVSSCGHSAHGLRCANPIFTSSAHRIGNKNGFDLSNFLSAASYRRFVLASRAAASISSATFASSSFGVGSGLLSLASTNSLYDRNPACLASWDSVLALLSYL